MNFHENYFKGHEANRTTNLKFGLFLSGLFFVLTIVSIVRGEGNYLYLMIAVILISVAVLKARVFAPLNHLWFLLGLRLRKITTPIMLMALFFLVVTPIGILLKVFKKDVVKLKWDPEANSYWVSGSRNNSSMKNQF